MTDAWQSQLGGYIRAQRRLANLTLRQMAALTKVSNPYLSQVERGLHQPSVRVLRSIATALNLSAESLLAQAGLFGESTEADAPDDAAGPTEAAIRLDPGLSDVQKDALVNVYRSFLDANR